MQKTNRISKLKMLYNIRDPDSLKDTKNTSLQRCEPAWPIYRQYHNSILAYQAIKGRNCKQEIALPQTGGHSSLPLHNFYNQKQMLPVRFTRQPQRLTEHW